MRYNVDDFKLFFGRGNQRKNSTEKWQPPSHGALKINVDGSMNHENGHGGWGFVIRDDQGDPVGSAAGYMNAVLDPLTAEATACHKSLQASHDWGIAKVEVETDSIMLVQALNSSEHDPAANGVFFREVKFFASLNFKSEFGFLPPILTFFTLIIPFSEISSVLPHLASAMIYPV